MKLAIAVVALCVVAAYAAPPSWDNNWSSEQIAAMRINQGGMVNPDGTVCCAPEAPQCKVQTEFMAATVYNWYDGKKSAQKNPDGSGVVSDYTAMKEYAVSADGTCQSYCPLQQGSTVGNGQFIFVNASDAGETTYLGKPADLWTWRQVMPILNITMQTTDFYVTTGDKPLPIAQIDHITPFGEPIGQQNNTFVTFKQGVPPASVFTVKGADKCPINQQCAGGGNDDGGNQRRLAEGEVEYRIERHMGVGPALRLVWD